MTFIFSGSFKNANLKAVHFTSYCGPSLEGTKNIPCSISVKFKNFIFWYYHKILSLFPILVHEMILTHCKVLSTRIFFKWIPRTQGFWNVWIPAKYDDSQKKICESHFTWVQIHIIWKCPFQKNLKFYFWCNSLSWALSIYTVWCTPINPATVSQNDRTLQFLFSWFLFGSACGLYLMSQTML